MTLHRRHLPIASPCDGFEGRAATGDRPAFCTRCEKPVYDLSRLTEREVVTLLARHVGRSLCVEYRTRADGTIAVRTPPPRLAPVALAASLAGCAAHLGDGEGTRAHECIDAAGYEVDCPPPPRLGDAVIPEAIASDDEPAAPVVDPGELIDVAGEVSRGLIATTGIAVTPPVIEPPPQPTPASQQRVGAVRLTHFTTTTRVLSRKMQREAKRLERRERRRHARETRRR